MNVKRRAELATSDRLPLVERFLRCYFFHQEPGGTARALFLRARGSCPKIFLQQKSTEWALLTRRLSRRLQSGHDHSENPYPPAASLSAYSIQQAIIYSRSLTIYSLEEHRTTSLPQGLGRRGRLNITTIKNPQPLSAAG